MLVYFPLCSYLCSHQFLESIHQNGGGGGGGCLGGGKCLVLRGEEGEMDEIENK